MTGSSGKIIFRTIRWSGLCWLCWRKAGIRPKLSNFGPLTMEDCVKISLIPKWLLQQSWGTPQIKAKSLRTWLLFFSPLYKGKIINIVSLSKYVWTNWIRRPTLLTSSAVNEQLHANWAMSRTLKRELHPESWTSASNILTERTSCNNASRLMGCLGSQHSHAVLL